MAGKGAGKGRPHPNPIAQASQQVVQPKSQQTLILEQQTVQYQGDIPPAQILQAFDERWPGTGQKIIDGALAEAAHRRDLERQVTEGNVRAQARHLDLVERGNSAQIEIARKAQNTERFGYVVGACVCLACAGLAVFIAPASTAVALGVAAIPTAGVVTAILNRRQGKPTTSK